MAKITQILQGFSLGTSQGNLAFCGVSLIEGGSKRILVDVAHPGRRSLLVAKLAEHGLTPDDIPCIAEVNPDKFGCQTPGTHIPIVSESAAREKRPNYFLVLPWHFKNHIVAREQAFLQSGGKLLFPLPKLEIVSL